MAPRDLSGTTHTADELRHHGTGIPLLHESSSLTTISTETTMGGGSDSLIYKGSGPVSISDLGFPGHLTDAEYSVFEQFRAEVHSRDEQFRSTVFCFEDANEEEAYALCRWLRARKFNLSDTIEMVKEATKCRSEAKNHNFFGPDPSSALGIDANVYLSQFPHIHYGFAKNGYPLFLSKPGCLNISGIECITTVQGVLNYHWFSQMHDMKNQYQYSSSSNQNFKRFECICIMDLENLTTSQLSKRSLHIIKSQTEVDSLCFPETLNKMIIINAPSFFTFTWKIIKGWVDVQTAAKVEIYGSKRSKWERRLRELVEKEELPSDYGGVGESTMDVLEGGHAYTYSRRQREQKHGYDEFIVSHGNSDPLDHSYATDKIIRHCCHTLSVRNSASKTLSLSDGQIMKLKVCTRSLAGGKLFITSPTRKNLGPKHGFVVRHLGVGIDEEEPTRIDLDIVLKDAGSYKVKIVNNGGHFSTEDFLLVGQIYHDEVSIDTTQKTTMIVSEETKETQLDTVQRQSSDNYSSSYSGDMEDIALTTPVADSLLQTENEVVSSTQKDAEKNDSKKFFTSRDALESQSMITTKRTFEIVADAKREASVTASTRDSRRSSLSNSNRVVDSSDDAAATMSSTPQQTEEYIVENDVDYATSTGLMCGSMTLSSISSYFCSMCG